MAWPTDGSNGWEVFGTPVESLPKAYAIPEDRGIYYDPSQLHGSGRVLPQGVHLFHGATIVSRGRSTTLESEFLRSALWSDALLDWLIFDPSEPCALTLDIYDDDRETIRWSAGTSAIHPNPYLVEPENYAEQEVDVAAGAATLGTVTVTLIDRFRIAGDQDSGWMTDLLTNQGIEDIRGRRARLRRFISEDLGYVVLADGPAGTPRMESDYASFSFDIRDTRETERKVRLFDDGGGGGGIEGARTLLPTGVYGGYGFQGGTYLIDPAAPLTGTYFEFLPGSTTMPDGAVGGVVNVSGNSTALKLMTFSAHEATRGTVVYGPPTPIENALYTTYRDLLLIWREAGSGDPWTEIGATLVADQGGSGGNGLLVSATDYPDSVNPVGRLAVSLRFGDTRGATFMPTDGQSVELMVLYRGAPSEQLPIYVEGVTAGEFIRDVYDGLYSPRDVDGNVVPTGIRYNEADLLQMTDVLRLKLTEPVDDARDWLEKHVYAPTGWAPALNDIGEISPVSQAAPLSLLGLTNIDNDIAEPSPDWNAGERVINVIVFKYHRDYIPATTAGLLNQETVKPTGLHWPRKATGTTSPPLPDGDGLVEREVEVVYVDAPSVDRNGWQELVIEATAFRAIGTSAGEPLDDRVENEQGAQLAALRQLHLGNRYSFGAPAVSVAVMRLPTISLRAGSWVTVDLTWFPDLHTGRRGLVALAQVIALSDLDCAWRRALLEIVTPLVEPGS